ncbi:MAG: DnaJ C-terminal domain-containing protein, partial [Chromatiales bacterium]
EEFRPPPGATAGGGRYHTRFSEDFGPDEAAQFSDFFETLFGGGGFRRGGAGFQARGMDQTARIQVSLEDAYHGASRSLQLDVPERDAEGRIVSRRRTLRVQIPRGVTDGQQIRLAGQGLPGGGGAPSGDLYLQVELAPHPVFRAEGRDIHVTLPIAPWEAALGATVPVPTLGGSVSLKIPGGSQSGRRLRLKGRGLPGKPAGDQYVTLQIVIPPVETEQAKQAFRELAGAVPFDPRQRLAG